MTNYKTKWFVEQGRDYILLFDEKGNLISNREYSSAVEYEDGILVKECDKDERDRRIEGLYYYIDNNFGSFNKGFYEASLPIKGNSVVRQTKTSNPQIRDRKGNLSEEYVDLIQCSDGAIIAREDYDKGQVLIEPDKDTASQEFYHISPENFAGIRIVKTDPINCRIRYTDGHLSPKTYKGMTPFDADGIATAVNKGDGKRIIYVDLLGREFENHDIQSAKDYAEFILGNIEIEDMEPEDFNDEYFCDTIRREYAIRLLKIVKDKYENGEDKFDNGEEITINTVDSRLKRIDDIIQEKQGALKNHDTIIKLLNERIYGQHER